MSKGCDAEGVSRVADKWARRLVDSLDDVDFLDMRHEEYFHFSRCENNCASWSCEEAMYSSRHVGVSGGQ